MQPSCPLFAPAMLIIWLISTPILTCIRPKSIPTVYMASEQQTRYAGFNALIRRLLDVIDHPCFAGRLRSGQFQPEL